MKGQRIPQHRKTKRMDYIPLLLMLLPGLVYLLINNYLPMYGLTIAFRRLDYSKGILNSPIVGFENFEFLFKTQDAWIMIRNTVVTLAGTLTNLVITSLFAYPLYRKDFKPRNFFAFVLFFTMLFSGGMTASYIMWTEVFHIKNTIWALIIPGHLMGAMNVLLVRNYYSTSIPESIVEAARIDGASELKIYTKIMIPLSKPVLITIALFSGMGYWNDWVNGMYYITDPKLYTITVYLNNVMNNINLLAQRSSMTEGMSIAELNLPTVGVRMAIAFTAILPVMVVFPFIQSKLIEGVVIGGVKG